MEKSYNLIVIGSGPAGLLAAGRAAQKGLKVLLLEKMEKTARKLRITGKGRCNITTTREYNEIIGAINPNGNFFRDALAQFGPRNVVHLLNQLGVPTIEERGKRVFPQSGKAWDVAQALTDWVQTLGADILFHQAVKSIGVENGKVNRVDTLNSKDGTFRSFSCGGVVLASGGKSYPATGSTGDGYLLAEQLGHSITPLLPVLVGFNTSPCVAVASGITLKNVQIHLEANGKTIAEDFGELEVMPFGLCGPIILKCSRAATLQMEKNKICTIALDFKPALSSEKLMARILREIDRQPRMNCVELLRKLLPGELTNFMAEQAGVAAQKVVGRLTENEKLSLVEHLKATRFRLLESRGWNEAIVTMGGVSLREVDPKTMASTKVEGLYLAGELLDLDGPTGGYNLQIAFSTGWLAGESAARSQTNC